MVDTVAHLFVTGGVQVQPVVLVEEGGIQAVGLGRVGDHPVKVDDAVEYAARADPFVQGDTTRFVVRGTSLMPSAVAMPLRLPPRSFVPSKRMTYFTPGWPKRSRS